MSNQIVRYHLGEVVKASAILLGTRKAATLQIETRQRKYRFELSAVQTQELTKVLEAKNRTKVKYCEADPRQCERCGENLHSEEQELAAYSIQLLPLCLPTLL